MARRPVTSSGYSRKLGWRRTSWAEIPLNNSDWKLGLILVLTDSFTMLLKRPALVLCNCGSGGWAAWVCIIPLPAEPLGDDTHAEGRQHAPDGEDGHRERPEGGEGSGGDGLPIPIHPCRVVVFLDDLNEMKHTQTKWKDLIYSCPLLPPGSTESL